MSGATQLGRRCPHRARDRAALFPLRRKVTVWGRRPSPVSVGKRRHEELCPILCSPRVPGLSDRISPGDFTEPLRRWSHSGPLPPPPPCWGHCFIREECGACVPSSFFQLPPKVGTGEPLRSTDGCLCSRFQKFRELVWDVNHASGLEKVAEPKPREVWGRPDTAAGLGAVLEAGQRGPSRLCWGPASPPLPESWSGH